MWKIQLRVIELSEQIIGRPYQILDESNIDRYMVWGYARRAVTSGEYDKLLNVVTLEYHSGLPEWLRFLHHLPFMSKNQLHLGVLVDDLEDVIDEDALLRLTVVDVENKLGKAEEFEVIQRVDDGLNSREIMPRDDIPVVGRMVREFKGDSQGENQS